MRCAEGKVRVDATPLTPTARFFGATFAMLTSPGAAPPACYLAAVQQARGNSGGTMTLPGHRPNAHGGALNRPQHTKLLPTAGNMGRLDTHFNAGAVQLRDDLLDTLGGYAGSAGSAVHNQVRAAHSGKAATAAATRSKDRSDRATGGWLPAGAWQAGRGGWEHAGRAISSASPLPPLAASLARHWCTPPRHRQPPPHLSPPPLPPPATPAVEQVLDPRTRMVLFKMLNRGVFAEINGCVSTGKEANVYHASGAPPGSAELAIKVYKTAILVFKDRDRWAGAGTGAGRQQGRAGAWETPAPPPLDVARPHAFPPHLTTLPHNTTPTTSTAPPPPPTPQVRGGRLPLPALLQVQPAQDGEAVGGEGDAKPGAPARGGHTVPQAAAAAPARPG